MNPILLATCVLGGALFVEAVLCVLALMGTWQGVERVAKFGAWLFIVLAILWAIVGLLTGHGVLPA